MGEKMTTLGMWAFLDKNIYHRVDNVIVPAHDGTTQIDHILVSIYGIFVIETKNLRGWIFGSPEQAQWTQSIFGQKYRFQNPIRQNYRHTKCLSEFLQIDDELLIPIVFFIGECEFKTPMPENVLNQGFNSYIKRFNTPRLSTQQVAEIEDKLRNAKAGKIFSKSEHLHSLEVRHSSNTCPRCGSQLVERVASRGPNVGSTFWGCSAYPRCKYIRNL